MSLELPGYRDVLASLNEHFGAAQWITLTQLAEYDRADPRTVRKRYGIPRGVHGINKNILARRICELSR